MKYYNIKDSGKRLKELRKKKGYTQEGFAHEIGISHRTYSGIESGAHSTSIDTLFKYLHYEFIKYLFIRRIMDISLEVEDLKKFIKDVNEWNVIIICLGEETAMFSGEKDHVNCITYYEMDDAGK